LRRTSIAYARRVNDGNRTAIFAESGPAVGEPVGFLVTRSPSRSAEMIPLVAPAAEPGTHR
jgi:hypothetical protein